MKPDCTAVFLSVSAFLSLITGNQYKRDQTAFSSGHDESERIGLPH